MTVTEIIPGLWQGGQLWPEMPKGWDAVMDCRWEAEDLAIPLVHPALKTFLWVPMVDGPELPDMRLLRFAVQSIAFCGLQTYRPWKVLVHCAEGLNRSGLVVGCYLRSIGYSGPDAVALIQSKRPGALNNLVFLKAVLDYQPT